MMGGLQGVLPPPPRLPMLLLLLLLLDGQVGRGEDGLRRLEYDLLEEVRPGHLVADIAEDLHLEDEYPSSVVSGLEYRFLRANAPYTRYFFVLPNGQLKVARVIDREEICAQSVLCSLTLDIMARPVPKDHVLVVQVRVTIVDINDHAPAFVNQRMTLNIPESAPPGSSFVIPPAHDMDSIAKGVRNYRLSLVPNDSIPPKINKNPFDLQLTRSSGSISEVQLVVTSSLDRETVPSYSLRIVVEDRGTSPKSSTLTLDVTVLDANDNRPVFNQSSYSVALDEDTRPPVKILRLKALDIDEGLNGKITYQWSEDTQQRYGSMFSVNNTTGDVWLKGRLDYDTEHEYQLSVFAKDQGTNPIPVQAKINVTVFDINDNAPRITPNSMTSSGRIELRENAERNTFVAHISVDDKDSGRNGKVVCVINNKNFTLEPMFANEFKLVNKVVFDFEEKTSYLLNISCSDKGNPPLRTSKEVVVFIVDENDNAPVFGKHRYKVRFEETKQTRKHVLRVLAFDRDSGQNANITYSLSPEANPFVGIEQHSGGIYINRGIDYEYTKVLAFQVVAKDHGNPSLSATSDVIINVVDINDEAPVFSQDMYKFGVDENQSPGQEIGSVSATDADSPPYNDIIYSLERTAGDSHRKFEIDRNTGLLRTRVTLDREAQTWHTLVVLAINPGKDKRSLTSSVSVSIYVADINDNAPQIHFPSPEHSEIQMPSAAPEGYVFSKVNATDADANENAKLMYSIADADMEARKVLGVDVHSGALIMKNNPSPMRDLYTLLIAVADRAKEPLTATVQVNVAVNRTWVVVGSGFGGSAEDLKSSRSQLIVISVAAMCSIIVLVLLAATILYRVRRRRHPPGDKLTYSYVMRRDSVAKAAAEEAGQEEAPQVEAREGGGGGEHWERQSDDSGCVRESTSSVESSLADLRHPPPPKPPDTNSTVPPSQTPAHEQALQVGRREGDGESTSTSGCSADMTSSDSETRNRATWRPRDRIHPAPAARPNRGATPGRVSPAKRCNPYASHVHPPPSYSSAIAGSTQSPARVSGVSTHAWPARVRGIAPPLPPGVGGRLPMNRKGLSPRRGQPFQLPRTFTNCPPPQSNLAEGDRNAVATKVPTPARRLSPSVPSNGAHGHGVLNGPAMRGEPHPRDYSLCSTASSPSSVHSRSSQLHSPPPPKTDPRTLKHYDMGGSSPLGGVGGEHVYMNTFGRGCPLQMAEPHEEISDTASTTTSGSFTVDNDTSFNSDVMGRVEGITTAQTAV